MTAGRPAAAEALVARVRHYYDANTRGFLRLGHGRTTGVIHRAVWGPGVTTREQALRYVDDRIAALAREMQPDEPLQLVDLGCGVGATLCYLLERLSPTAVGTGVTISEVQTALARDRSRAAGLEGRATWINADFCALPPVIAPAHLAYAIESFVHAADAAALFREAARIVRRGGLLVVCDDVLCGPGVAHHAIDAFKRGWRVNSLLERSAIARLAAQAGFTLERADDLTARLELGRPRDRLLAPIASAAAALGINTPRLGNIIGGTALQHALTRGWIAYELLVFRRATTPAA